jgi:hypothetical protein
MPEGLADQQPSSQHDHVPGAGVVAVERQVDMVQAHTHPPLQRAVLVTFAERLGDELSKLFEHRKSSPAHVGGLV